TAAACCAGWIGRFQPATWLETRSTHTPTASHASRISAVFAGWARPAMTAARRAPRRPRLVLGSNPCVLCTASSASTDRGTPSAGKCLAMAHRFSASLARAWADPAAAAISRGCFLSCPGLGYGWDGSAGLLRQHLVVGAEACQPPVDGRRSVGSPRDAYQPAEPGARLGHVELVEQPEQAGGCGRFGQRFRAAAAPQVGAAGKLAQIPLRQVRPTDGDRCRRWEANPNFVVSQLTTAVDPIAPAAAGSRHLLDGCVHDQAGNGQLFDGYRVSFN